jgi:glucokinase
MGKRLGKSSRPLLVGVDVGGSKIAALVAGADHRALGCAQVATDVTSPERTLDGVVAAVEQALAQAHAGLPDVAAIGLGIPGRVRPDSGVVESAVNLRWRQLPAGPLLAERLGVPCRLENDAKAAALGAYQTGGESRFQNWAYISVGTGIAAGLILGGRLHRGPNGMAGEMGHTVVQPGGPRCACGLSGCLEAIAAGPAIVREARSRLQCTAKSCGPSLLSAPGPLTTARVYEAACAGDTVARVVTRQAGWYLAQAVHSLVMTCDVERVVFGGGVARAGTAFLDPICEALDHLRQASPLAAEVLPPGLVGLLPPDHEAALWGALALAEADRVPGLRI